jgi:hypothetical protein
MPEHTYTHTYIHFYIDRFLFIILNMKEGRRFFFPVSASRNVAR